MNLSELEPRPVVLIVEDETLMRVCGSCVGMVVRKCCMGGPCPLPESRCVPREQTSRDLVAIQ